MQLFRFFFKCSSVQPLHGLGFDLDIASDDNQAAWQKPWLFILLLFLLFSSGYYFLIFNRALAELELETDTRTTLKFYWPNKQGNYSEKNSSQLVIKPGQKYYTVRVTDISRLDRLRLDPSENKAANIIIRRIALRQTDFPLYQLQSKEDFADRLRPVAEVEPLTPLPDGGVSMTVGRHDPQLELVLPKMERDISWLKELEHGLAILLLAAACWAASRLFSRQLEFAPIFAIFVLALILVMAAISDYNTHPDEFVHVAAAEYYKEHSLPPKVGDPAIAHTYSMYGVSRLHSGEIYYLLAGKFLRFAAPLHLKPYFAQRLFNVLLFSCLLLWAFGKPEFRPFFLPLLISPQIWYIFSYADSEALSVTVCLLAAWQLAAEHSSLNRLLRDEPEKRRWFAPLWLGLLFGLLLLQKQNFYFLYLFYFLYFIWRIRQMPPSWSKRTLARFTALVLVGGLLFTAFKVTDAWVNDFRKGQLELAAREQHAEFMYKPSTPLNQKHLYLQMRDRGKTLQQLIELDRWGEKTFRTAVGVYGYTQYAASFAYYDYVRAVGLLILLMLTVSAAWRGGHSGLTLLALAWGWSLFFIAALIHHAWTVDFQAQGRYLLPMIPMFAILHYHCQRLVFRPVFYGLFVLLFCLSVYNFIFIGLHDIGKSVL
uniref:hypothetical protein n=1 Tax=Candidatus Electronema sp. TaxID=2698783 RepID=UPI0040567A93